MNGYIKLHRKILDWEWYTDPNMVHLFLHLIMIANFRPNQWMGQTIERGQAVVGREKLSKITGISPQTLRTCLTRLKSTSEITIKSTNKFSIITICNYDAYQDDTCEINQQVSQQINKPSTSNQPATNQQLTTPKEEQEGKEVLLLSGKPDVAQAKKEKVNHYHPDARTALWFLNESACRHYRETDANLRVISARLFEEGVQLCCVKKMIERQCRKWKGTDMEDFLRPETLFGKQKFDGYYAARDAAIIDGKPDPKLKPIDPVLQGLEEIEKEYGPH